MSQESTISISDITTIATSTSTDVTTTIGDSGDLYEVNLHLSNIESIGRMILTLFVLVVTFRALYHLVDKVFFNGV